MVKKGVWLENLTGKGEDEKYLLRENEEKHLYDPVDYNPHIGLATIDHAGPFAGFGSVHTSPI